MVVARPERVTLAAFLVMCLIGGSNAVGVRFSNQELAPFWGAALRFLAASVTFIAFVALRGLPLPRGRALVGALVYGILNFWLSYAFVYWALVEAPAGTAQVVLAIVPLLTFLLAILHRVERFHWRGLLGALVAALGIVVIFGDQLGAEVPLVSLLALLAAAVCIAEVGVAIKWFPKVHPVVLNGIGMLLGGALLLALSLVLREPQNVPTMPSTWLALAYLVPATIVLFILVLYVLTRWTASATSYSFLLLPLVTIVLGALLADEPIRPAFLAGGALVLAGVYVGAFAPAGAAAAVSPAETTPTRVVPEQVRRDGEAAPEPCQPWC
jgi:drug/metabolite transporter (DMT)-like permease